MSAAAVTLKDSSELSRYPFFFALEASPCPAVDTGSLSTTRRTGGGRDLPARTCGVIWLLLVAAFVAILNETTMGIAIPHLNTDLASARARPMAHQRLHADHGRGDPHHRLHPATVHDAPGLHRRDDRLLASARSSRSSRPDSRCCSSARDPGRRYRHHDAAADDDDHERWSRPQSRGRMMGRVGLVISRSLPAIGPTLAGAVLEFASWRALFGIILPIALIALAMGAKWMTNLGETRAVPLDVLSIPARGARLRRHRVRTQPVRGARADRARPPAIVSLVVGALSLGLFVWRQLVLPAHRRRAARPAGVPLQQLHPVRDHHVDPGAVDVRHPDAASAVSAERRRSEPAAVGSDPAPRLAADGSARTDHGARLRCRRGHASAADPRHDPRLRGAILLLDPWRAHRVVGPHHRAGRHVGGTRDVVHAAVLRLARFAPALPVLARFGCVEHTAAGRRRGGGRGAAAGDVLVDPAPPAETGGTVDTRSPVPPARAWRS